MYLIINKFLYSIILFLLNYIFMAVSDMMHNRYNLEIDESNNLKSIPELMSFISKRKRFKLESAFDDEGSKNFLQSKFEAMEKMILDETIIENKEPEINGNLNEKFQTTLINNISNKENKNIEELSIKSNFI